MEQAQLESKVSRRNEGLVCPAALPEMLKTVQLPDSLQTCLNFKYTTVLTLGCQQRRMQLSRRTAGFCFAPSAGQGVRIGLLRMRVP